MSNVITGVNIHDNDECVFDDVTIRRATLNDVNQINECIIKLKLTQDLHERFNKIDIDEVIKESVFSMIAVCSSSGSVIGFVSFDDSPSVISDERMQRSTWPLWCSQSIQHEHTPSVGHTLWLSLLLSSSDDNTIKLFSHALHCLFQHLPMLQVVACALPLDVTPFPPLNTLFKELKHTSNDSSWRIFCTARMRARVRAARIEDHDDLVPVFEEQSEMIRASYGEYFLADIISAQDQDNRAFVLEADGRARGMLSVTTQINTKLLGEMFDLSPYNMLKRHSIRRQQQNHQGKEQINKHNTSQNVQSVRSMIDVIRVLQCHSHKPQEVTQENQENNNDDDEDDDDDDNEDDDDDDDNNDNDDDDDVEQLNDHVSRDSVCDLLSKFLKIIDDVGVCNNAVQILNEFASEKSSTSLVNAAELNECVNQCVDCVCESTGCKLNELEIVETLLGILGVEEDERKQEEKRVGDEINQRQVNDSDSSSIDARNLVCVTLCCIERQYEWMSSDLLPAIFESFPSRDYIIVSMPHASESLPVFTSFAPVQQTAHGRNFDSLVLSILSRASITERVEVCCNIDETCRDELNTFIENNTSDSDDDKAKLYEHIANTMSSTKQNRQRCLAVYANTQIIGLVNLFLLTPSEISLLEMHNDFESLGGWGKCARLIRFIINPLFYSYRRFVLGEAIRLLDINRIVYGVCGEDDVEPILDLCMSVSPRRVPHHRRIFSHANIALDNEVSKHSVEALNLFTKQQLCHCKSLVNSRIVIIGASETGLSVLRRIHSESSVHFAHVTLIAPQSISDVVDPLTQGCVSSLQLCTDKLSRLGLDARTHIVRERLVGIERCNKMVELADETALPYDYLVLCTGRQNQFVHNICLERSVFGAFDISCANHINEALAYVDKCKKPVVAVFGSGVNVLALLQKLLNHNNIGKRDIVWIDPSPIPHVSNTNNKGKVEANKESSSIEISKEQQEDIDKDCIQRQIHDLLTKIGIEHIYGLMVSDVIVNASTKCLESLKLESRNNITSKEFRQSSRLLCDGDTILMSCNILLSFHGADVDVDMLSAITKGEPLAFNDGLIVDGAFRTADRFIYAGGSLAKFSGRVTNPMNMTLYSSAEIGEKIAESLLRVANPRNLVEVCDIAQRSPVCNLPKTEALLLPKKYFLFQSKLASSHLTSETNTKLSHQSPGDNFSCTSNKRRTLTSVVPGRVTSLSISSCGIVDSIEYIGTYSIYAEDLAAMIGLPITAFNRIAERLQQGEVTDIIEFLEQDWARALSHDSLCMLQENMVDTLRVAPIMTKVSRLITKYISEQANDDFVFELKEVIALSGELDDTIKQRMQNDILRFVEKNQNHLPSLLFDANAVSTNATMT